MITDDEIDDISGKYPGHYLVLRDFARDLLANIEGYKMLKDSTQEERSWPEDASHENGNYSNTCCVCQRQFLGYKRRVLCKVCADTPLIGYPQ